MITRAFWTLFTVEAIAYTGLILWTLLSRRGWGPEGPVGAWLVVLVPPLMLGVPLAVYLLGQSGASKLTAIGGLALPLVMIVLSPVQSAIDNYRTERSIAGDATFHRPAQRNLAHALRAHDAALVKSLIPAAGDLNKTYGDDSLFRFALTNADKSPASVEIVKAMLDGGADPKRQTPGGNWPLTFAMYQGPAMVELLLNAGADPNSTDDAGRPVWWNVLSDSTDEGFESLRLLLDHGGDVTRRDSNNGPVGWAAHFKNWRAVWLLMERGAAWKGEHSFDQTIEWELDYDLQSRRGQHQPIPEEMEKIRARYEAGK